MELDAGRRDTFVKMIILHNVKEHGGYLKSALSYRFDGDTKLTIGPASVKTCMEISTIVLVTWE
jgi:hypothetical protein